MPQPSAPPRPPGVVTILDHPLVRHKLSLMRARDTSTSKFRQLMREISLLLGYEATRDLALEETDIETPLERARAPVLAGKKLCLVSILRAGNGILDGMLDLVPAARVGHIGIYREPRTLQAIEYYLKLPDDLPERDVILLDPMLATGNSAVAAISRLVELRARSIKFVCPGAAMPATGCSARNDRRCVTYRGRIQGERRSWAIATNLPRCAGDRIARKSRVLAVASRWNSPRFAAASSKRRVTCAASAWGFAISCQAAFISGATCSRIFSVRARIAAT